MDGATALKYVRSRHGNNGESSDFARSRRQQKVIAAAKDKIFSASTFLNPARLNRLFETLADNINTNLSTWEIIRLGAQLKNLDAKQIANHVLDTAPSSPFYATSLNGAYVILPKNDDWRPLQVLAENIFSSDELTAPLMAEAGVAKPKFVAVEIQNGTGIAGLAFNASQILQSNGYDIKTIGNAATREYEHTVIYDLTNGQKPEALKDLRDILNAEITLSATGWLISSDIIPKEITLTSEDYENLATEKNIDFLIILGQNSANLASL